MAEERKSGYCRYCGKRTVVSRKGTNHILHLVLTILTAGLWLIVWLAIALYYGSWRCSECGSKVVSSVH